MNWYRTQEGQYIKATKEVAIKLNYIPATHYELVRAFYQ